MKKKLFGILAVLMIVCALAYAQNTLVYLEQGGAKQVVLSGGEVEIRSGGTIDVQSGATFTQAGTITQTGAVNQDSKLDILSGGEIEISSGATFETVSGATVTLGADQNLSAKEDVLSGGEVEISSGATFDIVAGATVTNAAVNTNSGVHSFTLPIVLDANTTITAFATGGQASATALTGEFNNVTTCATAGDSVKLLTAVAGQTQTVKNSGATALDVFPFSGDAIDGLSADLAYRIPVGGQMTFTAIDATTWKTGALTGVFRLHPWDFVRTTGDAVTSSDTAGTFNINVGGAASGLSLLGEVSNGTVGADTETSNAVCRFNVPMNFIAGQSFVVSLESGLNGAGAVTATPTIDLTAKLIDENGTLGSDICATAVQNLTAGAPTPANFTITGTTITPGSVIQFQITTVVDNTNSTAVQSEVSNFEVRCLIAD